MSYYTVIRDNNKIRVVTCPKCMQADIEKFEEIVPYKVDTEFGQRLLTLNQCNYCMTFFSFYHESGLQEITKEEAFDAMGSKYGYDMAENGANIYSKSVYITFKCRPETITVEKYDRLMGYTHGDYDGDFLRLLNDMPTVNQLVMNRNSINNLDFDGMSYLNQNGDDYWNALFKQKLR